MDYILPFSNFFIRNLTNVKKFIKTYFQFMLIIAKKKFNEI